MHVSLQQCTHNKWRHEEGDNVEKIVGQIHKAVGVEVAMHECGIVAPELAFAVGEEFGESKRDNIA